MVVGSSKETAQWAQNHTVAVHPLVLLSASDAYHRVDYAGTNRRIVGVLLGQKYANRTNVSNAFIVPFEEDENNSNVWFLDHSYIESMVTMMKKINAKEKMVGWYHTGPKLRASDMGINDLFKRWIPDPVLVVIDVLSQSIGLPTDAYFSVEEIRDDGSATSMTFVHTPSIIEAEEAEEIGVEHLLRDVRDPSEGTLSTKFTQRLRSLQGLESRLTEIEEYLLKVTNGDLPLNHTIINSIQNIFKLLPNFSQGALGMMAAIKAENAMENDSDLLTLQEQGLKSELCRALTIKTNDKMMSVYISSLVRAVIALHDLIDNKITNRQESLIEVSDTNAEPKENALKGAISNGA